MSHVELLCAVMSRPRTAALVEGRISVEGVRFTDSLLSPERHRLLEDGAIAAGEMSTSGLVRSRAAGGDLIALPVFLKRGFSHHHVITREEAPFSSPADLAGRRVGIDSWSSSIMVWLRGLFSDAYGLERSDVAWVLAGDPPVDHHGLVLEPMPDGGRPADPGWVGCELVDGVERPLRSSERTLLALLMAGGIDAVLSTTVPHGPGLRCLFGDTVEQAEEAWYRSSGVYPINHTLAVQSEVLQDRPQLADELQAAFQAARADAGRPTPTLTTETAIIGHDPFAYTYGSAERNILQRFIEYQLAEGMIMRPFDADKLFTRLPLSS
jgi:4,5-dihydroxyphthalate decarboxylase